MLGDITALFSTLVSDKHWLVHQRAFQSVKSFAEVMSANPVEALIFPPVLRVAPKPLFLLFSILNGDFCCHQVTRYTHVMGDCVPENLLPTLSDFLNEVFICLLVCWL